MRNIWIICRKELRSYFVSPVAYLLLTMFALIFGYFFWVLVTYFDRAGLDPTLEPRPRMLRQQPGQRTVQALTGHFRRNLQIDDLELCGHRALEASGGASGILPRFAGHPL